MVLRLSSHVDAEHSSPAASGVGPSNTGDATIDRLVSDPGLSLSKKTDCVVVKNLVDPIKSKDAKYRTLKLENPKLQERLWSIPYVRTDLLEGTLGFSVAVDASNGEAVLTANLIDVTACDQVRAALAKASSGLTGRPLGPVLPVEAATPKQPPPTEQLSEKQKARRLLEQKEELEKIRAKEERKRNIALLKQDKITRETDPNWKPGLSAACAKSGSSISTFRDKYGES